MWDVWVDGGRFSLKSRSATSTRVIEKITKDVCSFDRNQEIISTTLLDIAEAIEPISTIFFWERYFAYFSKSERK